MTRIAVLGATGRSGQAAIAELGRLGAQVHAIVRAPGDEGRLPVFSGHLTVAAADTTHPRSLVAALAGATTVINAIRLRGDAIDVGAVLELHTTILEATEQCSPHVITVGGAGTLLMPGGERFVNTAGSRFPAPTASRARAHVRLREALEAGAFSRTWAYLIPPPRFDPEGPRTGHYIRLPTGDREHEHTQHQISYADFGIALAHAAIERWGGTSLIAGPHSSTPTTERRQP